MIEKNALPETESAEHIQFVGIATTVHSRKTVWKTEAGNITIRRESGKRDKRFKGLDNYKNELQHRLENI